MALYVDKRLKYSIKDKMAMDHFLECITIEIGMEKGKNIIISCIYRAPGSKIEEFQNWIEKHFSQLGNKCAFVCGDINIDLLNPYQHKVTEDFINIIGYKFKLCTA